MESPIETNQIPRALREAILSKKCVAFIGSGASAGYYPSWPDLINTLCERCGCDRRVSPDSPPGDYPDAAEDAKYSNEGKYHAALLDIFARRVDPIPRIYDVLTYLPFLSYLTVNLDPLLATKWRTARNACDRQIHAYPTLDRKDMGSRSVCYLHGMIAEKQEIPPEDTIVLARSDFAKAYCENSPLKSLLVSTFSNDPIVFVGCQLQEPVMAKVFGICKHHQLERQLIIEKSGKARSEPPKRFILLPQPTVETERESDGEGIAQTKASQLEEHYRSFDIATVWYSAPEGDHSKLCDMLEEIADLQTPSPDYEWNGATDGN